MPNGSYYSVVADSGQALTRPKDVAHLCPQKRLVQILSGHMHHSRIRKTQEGCGGLRGENPGGFPKAGPILQQPLSLPENAQTLAGMAFRAAAKRRIIFQNVELSLRTFPARNFGQPQAHSLLELSKRREWSWVFLIRMGAPESAQNSTCGFIPTQHDFPYLLSSCEGELFFENARAQHPLKGGLRRGAFPP